METTLLWIVSGYRVFAAMWLSVLGLVVLVNEATPVERPAVVSATIGAVVTWAAVATASRFLRPELHSRWWFVGIDLGISAWTVVAGTIAGTIQFAGGYPLVGAFAAIYASGWIGGAVAAVILTVAGLIPLLNREQSYPQEVANAIAFLFSVGAAVGVATALRTLDRRRVAAEAALEVERTERVRAEAHAEVATHLHDSVLQTLALIQRDAAATPDIRGLARHQERELRSWLFPPAAGTNAPAGGWRDTLVAVCSEIEDQGGVHVEVVVVGNTTQPVDPIVRAAREAIRNASKHAHVDIVSVYGEANDDEVLVFVKDRGTGFDPTAVPDSRHGIRESIIGRMERHGGSAEIISAAGSGTEVRLRLPLGAA